MFLSGVASTSYGIHYCWNEKFDTIVEQYPSKGFDRFGNPIPGLYETLRRLINWLIWLRLWVIIFIAIVVMCILVYIAKMKISGQPLSDQM